MVDFSLWYTYDVPPCLQRKPTAVDDCPIHSEAVGFYGSESKARERLKAAAAVHVQMQKLGDAMRGCGATEADVDRQIGLVVGEVESDIDFILNGQPF